MAAWQLLYAYMREGTSLRTLTLAEHCRAMNDEFADAVAESSIEELTCDTHQADEWTLRGQMRKILENPRLQRVVCRGALSPEYTRRVLVESQLSAADVRKFSFVEGPRDADMRRIFMAMDEAEGISSSDEEA
ncbi:hypothetical protein PsYK624_081000 [Phanerochaete sordida]|uniref:Uncharacterized protein n=1 Tax=Phanerochaete sordida TaxID=48140 RepID=A0A9P3LEW2_9APHY|nr:hypothetical protein PsYK624_081000 [Phanerochaete sordida]